MSDRELQRRRISRRVCQQAWVFVIRCKIQSLSVAMKLAWKVIKCQASPMFSKVRGVSQANRQFLLRRLADYPEGAIQLFFRRDIHCRFDSNTIQIIAEVRGRAAVIGYLSKEKARWLGPLMDSGRQTAVLFQGITGLNRQRGYLGCNFGYFVI